MVINTAFSQFENVYLSLIYRNIVSGHIVTAHSHIVTADAKKTHLNKLQKVQNYALRIALSLPVYTKIAALHTLGDCDMIKERLNLLKSQAINRYQGSEIMDDMALKTLLLKK